MGEMPAAGADTSKRCAGGQSRKGGHAAASGKIQGHPAAGKLSAGSAPLIGTTILPACDPLAYYLQITSFTRRPDAPQADFCTDFPRLHVHPRRQYNL